MSQVTYEIIRKLFEIYPIILQIVLFLVLWNVFFRWEKGIWIVAGILAVMNICMGLWLEKPGVIRYTMSAVIVLGYCFCKYQKHLEKAVFILLLFYNFHALSYLIADSIYQCTVESIFRGLDVLSEEYIFRVYLGMAIGMGILLLSYTLVLLIMTGVVIKIVKKPFMLRWQETIFLSVLNIVGSMIVGISVDLSDNCGSYLCGGNFGNIHLPELQEASKRTAETFCGRTTGQSHEAETGRSRELLREHSQSKA